MAATPLAFLPSQSYLWLDDQLEAGGPKGATYALYDEHSWGGDRLLLTLHPSSPGANLAAIDPAGKVTAETAGADLELAPGH